MDIDYNQLFLNGQLIYTEPEHFAMLERMLQAYRGQAEETIFRNKYRAYLQEFHPEMLSPVVVQPTVMEPVIAAPEAAAAQEVEFVATVEAVPEAAVPVEGKGEAFPPVEEKKPSKKRGRAISSQQ